MPDPQRKFYWWVIGGLVVLLVFGNQGFRELFSTYREKRRLEKTIVQLRKDHERLSRELGWIRQDPSYSEYLVRKNLGYVKKGEVEYRLIKSKKDASKNR